jgi:predicted transcriptional regulator
MNQETQSTPEKLDPEIVRRQAVEIVSAHISNNNVAQSDLPDLIQSVYQALEKLASGVSTQKEEKPTPAVPIRKSVQPEYIVCLEDGKKLKMLKRYIKRSYDLTPEEYRQRWGLPSDYPMTAPNYAAERSRLAKQIGLGRKTEAAPPPKARGGRRKTAKASANDG